MSYWDVTYNLITLDRAKESIKNFYTGDDAVLQNIVSATSKFVCHWCNRIFAVNTYDELIDGTGERNLLLSQFPVIQVVRLSYFRTPVIQIFQQDKTHARASFRIDNPAGSGNLLPVTNTAVTLTLTSVRAGVETDIALTLSDYVQFSDLATAINGVGDGWFAYAMPPWTALPVADLRAPQGASDCLWGTPYVWHHVWNSWDFEQNQEIGEIVPFAGVGRGYKNWRCIYKAGYADQNGNTLIPPDLQQATAELAAACYMARETDPNLQSQSLGDFQWARVAAKNFDNLSIVAKQSLAMHKAYRCPRFCV
jgi:hypothetical protein